MATPAASIQYCTRSCSQGIRQKEERKEEKKGGREEEKKKEKKRKGNQIRKKGCSTCGWHALVGYTVAEVLICSTY